MSDRNNRPTEIMKIWANIMDYALQINERQGGNFPVWGTCLGYEAIVYKFSEYKIPTTQVNSLNTNKKLNWKMKNYKHSLIGKELRKSVMKAMSKSNHQP